MEAAKTYTQHDNTDIKMFKYKMALQFYINKKAYIAHTGMTYQLQGKSLPLEMEGRISDGVLAISIS